MGLFKKPIDYGAMTMDELMECIEESRESNRKLRAKKKRVDKVDKRLGTAKKTLEVSEKIGFFDKLGLFIRSKATEEADDTAE